MKISLIRPPAYSVGLMGAHLVPFLGISYIAAVTRKAGYDVDIIDMCGEDIECTEIVRGKYVVYGMNFSALKKRLKDCDVIGFSSMFSQDWVFHRELIQYVSRLNPEAVLVAGGEHVSALAEYCMKDCPQLDVCVIGEGEGVFVQLLDALQNKKEFSGIRGLVYRINKGSNFHCTQRAERIRDIDKIPYPAWDLTPMENYLSRELNYHISRGRTIPMLATRGCPYSCSFCSNPHMWSTPWITRGASLVVDEMQHYITRYRADNFVFSDLTAMVTKESIVNLCCDIIKRRLNITWQLPTLRTEDLDFDVLELMQEAGCRELDFAVESGSKNVLISVNKKSNPDKVFSLVKDGLTTGMNLSTNIVIGLPEERFKDFLKTYFLLMKLATKGLQEVNVFPFIPYPGSELFQDLLNRKRIRLNDEYFFGLFGYADLAKNVSWSKNFAPLTLSLMRLFLFVSFYSLMFITHPGRMVRLAVNIARGNTTSKLEGVVKRVLKNIKVYFFKKY
ncbi:MAG: radical SAM protein [Candidatus Saelkia tenebricola]|nr:radical SAM protein [Candidatus Saelkia tenebricola]